MIHGRKAWVVDHLRQVFRTHLGHLHNNELIPWREFSVGGGQSEQGQRFTMAVGDDGAHLVSYQGVVSGDELIPQTAFAGAAQVLRQLLAALR